MRGDSEHRFTLLERLIAKWLASAETTVRRSHSSQIFQAQCMGDSWVRLRVPGGVIFLEYPPYFKKSEIV